MSDAPEFIDPPPGAAGAPIRYPEFKLKKLAASVPGSIRMVNKVGSALSAGTRAVEFTDCAECIGLDETEQMEMEKIVEEFRALNDQREPCAVELLNMYCESRANRTIAEIYPWCDANGVTHILAFIDVFLSGEELEDYEDANQEISQLMSARKAKRKEEKEARENQEKEAARQKADDEQLGKMAREHNIVEKLREAEEKLEKIRKAGNRLAKKAGVKDWLKEDE